MSVIRLKEMPTMAEITAPLEVGRPVREVPQNGLAGLKHWKYDLRSGFMVAMISLPFSMGIAITSGAPPICGITSAIIAGFVLPFLGGSYVTISGPAAGLAPSIYATIFTLGSLYLGKGASKDRIMAEGYQLALVAICLAGLAQVVLARLKIAQLCAIFPAAAIEGMLAAIGLMIIVKQFPYFLGQKFEAHEFWGMLQELPQRFGTLDATTWRVLGLGVACTGLIFLLNAIPGRLLKVMPPPVWVFFAGTLASSLWLHLDERFLIHVPDPLQHGIVLPRFSTVWQMPQLWPTILYFAFLLVLIDGTESLATIMAVDKIDPYRRRSDPDRTLLAMGVSNVASSVCGGLTIIPGIIKSTANIIGGGRTQWANFYNAMFLLGFLLLARPLINQVPYVVLASILTFVGYKLCRPKVWVHVAQIGLEQFVVFATTVLVTVSSDLLIGIFAGVLVKLAINLWYVGLVYRLNTLNGMARVSYLERVLNLVRNPVVRRELRDGVYHLYLERPLVCFNLFHVIRELQHIPPEAQGVDLHIGKWVALVDHTTAETLFHYVQDFNSRELPLRLVNWEQLRPLSDHPSAIQLGLSGELIEAEPPRREGQTWDGSWPTQQQPALGHH
jgi:MFS superfamily sulfate permease-like transporter